LNIADLHVKVPVVEFTYIATGIAPVREKTLFIVITGEDVVVNMTFLGVPGTINPTEPIVVAEADPTPDAVYDMLLDVTAVSVHVPL